jgi:GT2 family glycosyltransferase
VNTPEISVVAPTHRRPDLLLRLLDSLAQQTMQPDRFEIVVVDDASGDDTPRVLEQAEARLPNLHWESLPAGAGPATARNRGIHRSSGAMVLFLDDDVEAIPELLAIHAQLHAEAGDPLLGVLGRVDWHPGLEISPFMRWLDRSGLQFAYDTWLKPGLVDPPYGAFYTANLSVRRELLVRAGGFDERFPYPAYEDMELAWRLTKLGFRMDYRPDARVYHTRAIDLATFKRRMARVAESAVLLAGVQPDFPLDATSTPERWRPPPHALRRRINGVLAEITKSDRRRARYYRGEVNASYREGLARGRARRREGEPASR